MAEASWYVWEVLTDMLGLNLLDQIKNSCQKGLRDTMFILHWDSFEGHIHISLQFYFFYQKGRPICKESLILIFLIPEYSHTR